MRDAEPALFTNGIVFTGDAPQPPGTWVEVERGVVRRLGRGAPPAPDRVHDLRGRTLAPGFCDAHVHLAWLATALLGADLGDCDGVDAVLERIRRFDGPGRGPGGEWVVGYGFDESTWSRRRLPTRAELDAVQPRRPVLLQRVCGHVGIANSAALHGVAAGPHTDVETGRLAEDDLYAVNDRLRPVPADLAAVWPRVAATLHAHGITRVHDVASPELLAALQSRVRAGGLGVRVSASMPARYLAPGDEGRGLEVLQAEVEAAAGSGPDAGLRLLGIKIFTDGSLGAHTAFLRRPYTDAPATRGKPLYGRQELAELARRVDAAGYQLMVHAIGDAGLDLALDALEPVLQGGNRLRHRIEHAEVTPPDLVARLAASGVRVCVQPNFARRWSQPGGMNEQRLGERLVHCNAYRSLHAAGIRLAFGSDTMPLGPTYGLAGAVAHPLAPERLDAATALHLYTAAAAELVGASGRIAPGSPADLVVLEVEPAGAAGGFAVEATFVAGRQVHPPAPPG